LGPRREVGLLVVAATLFAATWYYALYVVPAYQRSQERASGETSARIISDLYPRWVGTREMLLYRTNPYSDAVTHRIQAGLYRPDADMTKVRDQQAFAYPVYVALLLAPFMSLPFTKVAVIFACGLLGCAMLTALLWSKVIGAKWKSTRVLFVVMLTCASLAVIQGVQLQNLTLLVALLLTATVALLRADRLIPAGVLLAVATIKPQLALPFVAWVVLWSAGEWRRRWRAPLAFAVAMLALCGCGEMLLGGWLLKFVHAIGVYRSYNAPSILTVLLGNVGGVAATVALVLAVAVRAGRMRRVSAQSTEFVVIGALVLAVTLVCNPTVSLYNQVLLLPAFLLFAANAGRSTRTMLSRALFRVAWLVLVAPWICVAAITVLSAFRVHTGAFTPVPYYIHIALPLVVTALLLSMAFNRQKYAIA
jgi:Glycosyltransferase family 87